jgi:hypothetical protein
MRSVSFLGLKDVQNKVESIGIETSYTKCLRAYQHLQKEFIRDDSKQYSLLPSYIEAIAERGHISSLIMTEDNTFDKLDIVFREGLQSFHHLYLFILC